MKVHPVILSKKEKSLKVNIFLLKDFDEKKIQS